jgi:hypothetical protein
VQPHRWLRMDNPLPSIPRIGSVILSYASSDSDSFAIQTVKALLLAQYPASSIRTPTILPPLTSGTISSSSPNAALLNIPSLASSILTIPCLQLLQRNRHIMRTTYPSTPQPPLPTASHSPSSTQAASGILGLQPVRHCVTGNTNPKPRPAEPRADSTRTAQRRGRARRSERHSAL